MPDITFRINTAYDGTGAEKAKKDVKELEHNGGKASLATAPPNLNAQQTPTKQEAAKAQREEVQRNKALIADAEEDLARAKAKGAGAGTIGDLESQVREQKLKARFMREQGLSEDDATEKARSLVALQNEAKARKQGAQEQAKEEKRAAAEKAQVEKAAAAAKQQEEKKTQAEEKRAALEKAKIEKQAQAEAVRQAKENFKDETRQSGFAQARQFHADDLRALELRAAGNKKGAEALERQNAIRKRGVDLERQLNVNQGEGLAIAEREFVATEAIQKQGGGFFGKGAGWRIGGQAATAALSFGKRIFDDQLEASRDSARIASEGIHTSNRTVQIAGIGGVRGEEMAGANFQAQRAELQELEAKRGTFGNLDGGYWDQFKNGLKSRFGVKSWFGLAPIETSSEKANRDNEDQITRKQNDLQLAQHLAQKKYRDGVGGMELAAQKERLQGHMKEARAIEYKIIAEQKYNEVLEKSGSKEMAQQAADQAVAERKKIDAGNFARSLDGRAGQAEIFRVATMAAQFAGMPVNSTGVHDELKAMHGTMRDAYLKGTEATWRAKFSRRTHN